MILCLDLLKCRAAGDAEDCIEDLIHGESVSRLLLIAE